LLLKTVFIRAQLALSETGCKSRLNLPFGRDDRLYSPI